ncbi:ExeA family protein [Photobacterium lutimaris]|uniref:General secretion pathway protein GspA n=1 Tax=Photobacterium lutimaris TaxID=388278 RepID=A0A2T3IRC7_9GAMM|nr:ExeA family protein [Photobacterium lutimaris]PSU30906.1 general secretion pathway protein GspA [Photobacterium lutimaris]TDR72141.1 general secretion pathway protein A [Photobacterium lutimaris]
MYKDFFGINESPFSIVPSARFLYLSERHREALTHMLSSLNGGGGFGLLTGEVGTGKTTVLRALVSRLPQETQVAIIMNPSLSTRELLASLCDELGIEYSDEATIKNLTDGIYQHLLANHREGRQTLLLIDEAQHLLPEVLEQLRLLTNLETDSVKLLKVVLVGQPELQQLLQQDRLRQLAQRITSRYHLLPLTEEEVREYIHYRLQAVDCLHEVFPPAQTKQIAKATGGIPRLINLVCDKSMQLAHQQSTLLLNKDLVEQACHDVLSWQLPQYTTPGQLDAPSTSRKPLLVAVAAGIITAVGVGYGAGLLSLPATSALPAEVTTAEVTKTAVPAAAFQPAKPVLAPAHTQSVSSAPQLSPQAQWLAVVKQAGSERLAMQTLYSLWGYSTQLNQANCESGSRVQLSCFNGNGSLEQLALINRPAIVALNEPSGEAYFATIYAIGKDKVELLLAGQRFAVSVQWLSQRWDEQYTLLWRPPLGDKTAIRYGQQGPRVQWLDRQLSQLLGVMPENQDTFEQALLNKLRRFQRAQDLSVDGIAGPRTLMVIDSALNLPGPTLQPEKS